MGVPGVSEEGIAVVSVAPQSYRRKRFPTHILVFLAPAFVIYTVFMIYPIVATVALSLYKPVGTGVETTFAGLDNYIKLVSVRPWDVRFWGAVQHNLVFFLIQFLVQNPIGLLLAVLLSRKGLKLSGAYRTILYVPAMLSIVIAGFIWQLMLSPLWGIVKASMDLLHIGALFQPWLGLESSALVTLSLISVWQFVGIPMMLYLTSLMSIPDELVEAARVDGATGWTTFWRIQFPLILPTVGIVSILTCTGSLNLFDLTFALEGPVASPNYATDVLGTFFYRTFYGNLGVGADPAMGTTIAGMSFLLVLSGVLLYLIGWQRRTTAYEL
jgi:raffinose/stachyose/melibiose transport system permease protein